MSYLKKEFLRLLEEDVEFRYAVAGRLGILEILRKLDTIAEEQKKIWEEIRNIWNEIKKLREEQTKIWREIERVDRHICALGARWGLMAEDAFREGLRGVLEREFGLRVERWRCYDDSGHVYGYPSEVEIDIAVRDEKIILIEVASHVKTSDVYEFKRKVELYIRKTGRRPDRLLIVTPYAEEKAFEAAKRHGVEIYTKV